jgi:pyruvate/2-oxoacid:ferredoxin oxidoreductase beta subunit
MYDKLQKNHNIYTALEETDEIMTWCDDCGNYGIQKALFQALTLQGITPVQTLVAYDV